MGKEGVKRPKGFVELGPKEKRNPNALRQVLHEIHEELFGGNRSLAARALSKVLNDLPPSRHRPMSISAQSLKRIFDNETRLMYWHIEMYAEAMKITSALLLTYSRLKANSRTTKGRADTQRLIYALRKLTENTRSDSPPTFSDLRTWAEWYKGESRGPLL